MLSRTFWMPAAMAAALAVSVTAEARTLSSHFTSGTEGWTITGEAIGPIWEASGGSPGGFLSATSVSGGAAWYWRAPVKFRGDRTAAYGRALHYDIRSATFDPESKEDVILVGGGLTVSYDSHGASMGSWVTQTIPLAEGAGWHKQVNGRRVPATRMDLRMVLASVEDLRIRGEGGAMMGQCDLDTVVLSEGPDGPETIPTSPGVATGAGLLTLVGLTLVCRRRRG